MSNELEIENEVKKKKGIKFYLPLIFVILIVIGGAYYWYREYTKYISTDDAYVDSDNVSLSPKIMGRIITLKADEGDSVKQGMLLAELDSTDLVSQKNQAIAAKQQAIAAKAQAEAKYDFDRESINVLEINFEKTQEDWERAKTQFAGEVITKEMYDHAKKAFDGAKAQLEVAKTQLEVSKAQIGSSAASVESAQTQIGVVSTQLKNTKIFSPIDGIVAKRWMLPGDVVQPGQSILTINNNHRHWVIIYLEETKLSELHIGQKAIYTIDAFRGVKFTGKIYQIGSNTASQFSLIPPNNASGNFTKVTQRVPIKISIEGTEDNRQLKEFNFLSGMSAVVKIIRN